MLSNQLSSPQSSSNDYGQRPCLPPFVSVIMPLRNERAFIARSLGAVLNQDYPGERMEILIADGMSDDGTVEFIRRLPGAERVRIISNPQRIQSAGLNLAIEEACGQFIVRVDGHTVIAPDYVRQCVAALQVTGAHNVGGPMDPVGMTPTGRAIAAAGKSPFAVPTAFHVSETEQYTDTVYLGAWPREVFHHVGLFNTQVGVNEDYEMNYRIRQSGGSIYLSPAIRSQYYGRQTLTALAKQYFHYGRSKVIMLRRHPASARPRQVIAPAFVAALVGGVPLSLVLPPAGYLWLAMLLLYTMFSLCFSARVARRSEARLFWRLPLVFLTIHAAWGAGFWVGVSSVIRGNRQDRRHTEIVEATAGT